MDSDQVDELAAVRDLSSAFTSIRTAIELVQQELHTLQRSSTVSKLIFNERGRLAGIEHHGYCDLATSDYDSEIGGALVASSAAEYIEKYVVDLYESQRAAEMALHALPARIIDLLSDLIRRPWDVVVRRECLDWVIAWPGENLHPSAIASRKIPIEPRNILELAEKQPPFEVWAEYGSKLKSYGADLVALRGRLKPASAGMEFVTPQEIAPSAIGAVDQIPVEFRTIPIQKKYAAVLLGYKAPKKNANPQLWIDRRKMKVMASGGLFIFDYREFPPASWEKIVTPQTWVAIRSTAGDNKS